MRRSNSTPSEHSSIPVRIALFSAAIVISIGLFSCITIKSSYKPHQFGKSSSDRKNQGDASDSGSGTPAETGDLTLESVSVHTGNFANGETEGARVLKAGIEMLAARTIVIGSCWDYVNRVYTNAGFPGNKRYSVFASKETGPYVDPLLILPGDWIQFRNLTFQEIGHSAIFAGWIDFDRRLAMTIEYAGQNRNEPGRYREYDITKCFGLLRGKE